MEERYNYMAQSIPLETYITLEKEFGKAVAEKVTTLLDFSFAQAEKKVVEIAIQKKLEIRDELSKELASKSDLALVKAELLLEIEKIDSKLSSEIKASKNESRIYFIILLCVLIILNKESISLIGQLLGLFK
ncbi:MAG: hypothetical protein SFY32_12875 [Bacteroidota bacterium]|nr:hypothetical protein [Bacteroidota bacterium]